jgi:hypothetical protein
VAHLAALYDCIEVQRWLVEDKGMSLEEWDGCGWDVLLDLFQSGSF